MFHPYLLLLHKYLLNQTLMTLLLFCLQHFEKVYLYQYLILLTMIHLLHLHNLHLIFKTHKILFSLMSVLSVLDNMSLNEFNQLLLIHLFLQMDQKHPHKIINLLLLLFYRFYVLKDQKKLVCLFHMFSSKFLNLLI